ncbi:pyridoxamine 5'-phosphate oxidase family protein [Mucilaginibacter ginsenosidivorans]|uniref:Pyridoxamine 5'-phosphate oxidase family protein n=1 Tax=Mucilaginibacter ginsenosidivorans TaxID=398053 RepID=A0A5B8UWW4_9SPHI|nr:pyridoxamine 5'-phosphate oxidase family protein [Mucilaginibacter ginsenosidivorans]QEC63610.1 pyridoxamine 5'-phosphate oxidase family protein [Mucilaginibacter ginsenosidivorans]
MAKFSDGILPQHSEFIDKQKMFFVASAPLNAGGHVNLSPKGIDSFRVLSPNKVAYMDIIGSGNETSAHMLENGRVTFMFCAYDGPPNILRLYGKGYTVLPGDAEWENLSGLFELQLATRQIIVAEIDKVQTSCGFSVPLYEYVGERDHAQKWAASKGVDGLESYKKEKNRVSLDGLPTALFGRLA